MIKKTDFMQKFEFLASLEKSEDPAMLGFHPIVAKISWSSLVALVRVCAPVCKVPSHVPTRGRGTTSVYHHI